MKNFKTVLLIILGLSLNALSAEKISHIDNKTAPLNSRLKEARSLGKESKDSYFWMGYSIDVLTKSNIHVCHHGSDYDKHLTLEELVTGQIKKDKLSVKEAAKKALKQDSQDSGKKVQRKFGILLKANKKGEFVEVNIMDFDSHVTLEGRPLVWMGQVNQKESYEYLTGLYRKIKNDELKEDMIAAISFHSQQKETVPFLKKVAKGKENDDIREQAVFWLARQDADVLDFLVAIAHNDRSEDVREHAVFAVSLVDGKDAEEALITLAKKDKDPEIRKKAVFWLGQKASEKVTEYLQDVIENDPDTEVKEHAVFALSQLNTDESAKMLMKIGKTHPNREVRKKAIFWLGQSDHPEAVDYLISLVRELD